MIATCENTLPRRNQRREEEKALRELSLHYLWKSWYRPVESFLIMGVFGSGIIELRGSLGGLEGKK